MLTYKFRIYPKKSQITKLNQTLEECRMLYNNFLNERKGSWEKSKKSLGLYEQHNRLPKLKKLFPNLKIVYSQVLQNVGVRVDLAFQAFFRRCKNGEKPGYPRFKGYGRYDSFCYPSFKEKFLTNNFIYLSKIGDVKIIKHREIEGKAKTVTVKRVHEKWYVFIVTDAVSKKEYPQTDKSVGIDVGIETFATFTDGNHIKNPRFFEKKQKDLAKAQRRFQKARDSKIERNIKKKRRVLGKIHEKIVNARHNFNHQTSNSLVKNYQTIIVEDIDANSMIRKRWCNKQILDAAWGNFINILTHKAECAGRKLVKVNPAYTSQTCSKCGTRTLHELKDRIFNCSCGHSENRDLNAARNILTLGLQSLARA